MSSSDVRVTLEWTGEGLTFEGGTGKHPPMTLDSSGTAAPSPMDALLAGLAGCMAIDVVDILGKSRVDFDGLSIVAEGDRAEEPPRRFTSIRLRYTVLGVAEEADAKLQRAIDLSRDKYCSVLHSLRPDLELEITVDRG